MAPRKKQQTTSVETVLTATAQMIGAALGRIAAKTGIDGPSKPVRRTRKKASVKKNVAAVKRTTAKRPAASHTKRAATARKRTAKV
jgi:hypothetical protein